MPFVRPVLAQRELEIVDPRALERFPSGWRVVRLARRQAETEDLEFFDARSRTPAFAHPRILLYTVCHLKYFVSRPRQAQPFTAK